MLGGALHKLDEAFDQIVGIAEGAGLAAVAIDGDRSPLKGLNNEVRDDAPVIGMHARPVGVEDAGHLDIELVLAVIVEKQGLGAALAFIVADRGSNGIHMAPIILGLRMDDGSP